MHCHGRLDNYLGIGVNNLIKEGAILTTNIEDILQNYPQFKDRMCIKHFQKPKFENKSQDKCKNIKQIKISSISQTHFQNEIQNKIHNQEPKVIQNQVQEKEQKNSDELKQILKQSQDNNSSKLISSDFTELYKLIEKGYIFLDEIFAHISSGKDNDVSSIMEKLINMELEGLIKKEESGGYKIIE